MATGSWTPCYHRGWKQWKNLTEKCSKKSHLLELWANRVDFMDNVLHSMDAMPGGSFGGLPQAHVADGHPFSRHETCPGSQR